MTMSRVVTVPKHRRTWRTMLLSGAAVPRLAKAEQDAAYHVGDHAVVLPTPPRDFDLTLPGTVLTTGQTAEVLTRMPQGPTLYWEISTHCARRIPTEDVPADALKADDLGSGINPRAEDVDHFVCTPYELTFLGAGNDGNPVVQPAVSVPVLTACDASGASVNPLIYSVDTYGDSHENGHADSTNSASVPTNLEQLAEGNVYRGSVFSYVRAGEQGTSPAGVRFVYQAEGSDLDPLDGGKVIWR